MSAFNYADFYASVANTQQYQRFVEVGVFEGESVCFLARKLIARKTPFQLYAVDLWERVNEETSYDRDIGPEVRAAFETRLVNEGVADHVQPVQGSSEDSAKLFRDNSVDFVFLDANHAREYVEKDIQAWLPKMRTGGMISGHDFNEPCGVTQAVTEAFGKGGFQVVGTCWYKIIQ